jgi:DNA-binding GntR family transcriptional regulator
MADAVVARDLAAATDAIRHHYQYTRIRILPALDLTTE